MSDAGPRNLELEANALRALDEDATRVYADWLQTQGDPRGELVSLELHYRSAFYSERAALHAEIAARAAPYREQFMQWAAERKLEPKQVRLRQGFVVDLHLSLPQLQRCCTDLFEREPLQRLTLTGAKPKPFAAFCAEHGHYLERLRYLKVVGSLDAVATEALANAPLDRLERLNLLGTGLDSDACVGLAQLQTKGLRALTLTANTIDTQGLLTLLGSATREQWRSLYFSGNPVGAPALHALAADPALAQFEALYAKDIEADFADFECLIDSSLSKLEIVEVSSYGSWSKRTLLNRLRKRFSDFRLN